MSYTKTARPENADKKDVYTVLTEQIIDALENGTVPWHMPWLHGAPRSLSTGNTYKGFNLLMLSFKGNNHDTPFWGTYKQIQALGGSVKKGERSTPVAFYKRFEVEDSKEPLAEGEKADTRNTRMMTQKYAAFNASQADWPDGEPKMIKEWRAELAEKGEPVLPIDAAEALIAAYPDAPKLVYQGTKAFYRPSEDLVQVPKAELFESSDSFYQTTFHELIHSTGHPKRNNRFNDHANSADIAEYSKEELVAEIGAAFLCHEAGITPQIEQSGAYCKSWLAKIKGEPRMLLSSAAQAAKAADVVLGRSAESQRQKEEPVEEIAPKVADAIEIVSVVKTPPSQAVQDALVVDRDLDRAARLGAQLAAVQAAILAEPRESASERYTRQLRSALSASKAEEPVEAPKTMAAGEEPMWGAESQGRGGPSL